MEWKCPPAEAQDPVLVKKLRIFSLMFWKTAEPLPLPKGRLRGSLMVLSLLVLVFHPMQGPSKTLYQQVLHPLHPQLQG
jgi:hypothetical protein